MGIIKGGKRNKKGKGREKWESPPCRGIDTCVASDYIRGGGAEANIDAFREKVFMLRG